MKKVKQKGVSLANIDGHVHLWNIRSTGSGKAVSFLKTIVDSIHHDNPSSEDYVYPTILITGNEGKATNVNALINSLAMNDLDYRECEGEYFDNGIYSRPFFKDSSCDTVYVINNIDRLKGTSGYILWEFIKHKKHTFQNWNNGDKDCVHLHGLLVMTTSDTKNISPSVLKEIDYIIDIESCSALQQEEIVKQRLDFSDVAYEDKAVEMIVKVTNKTVSKCIDLLKRSFVIMRADGRDKLSLKDVERAFKLGDAVH